MAKKNSTKRPDKIIPMSNKWIQEADLKTGAFTAQAKKAGVPMLVSRGFRPFYSGIPFNIRYVERLLRGRDA